MKIGIYAIGMLAFSLLFQAQAVEKVIYGEDNRLEEFQVQDRMIKKLARSTAAMVSRSNLKEVSEHLVSVTGRSFGDRRNLCSDEPFREQPSAANCSGFLVGPNLLVTAGHCIPKSGDGFPNCKQYRWVFDYAKHGPNQKDYKVRKSSVYSCKRVLSQVLNRSSLDDFALIELDRRVIGRTPLKFRKNGKVEAGQSLIVIGHPAGLPRKIADQANVRVNTRGAYFSANLDTYGGNSGSAVFNAETGMVEGILVRGETDYVTSSRGCTVSNRCSDTGCRGEDVTRITNIKKLMAMEL